MYLFITLFTNTLILELYKELNMLVESSRFDRIQIFVIALLIRLGIYLMTLLDASLWFFLSAISIVENYSW